MSRSRPMLPYRVLPEDAVTPLGRGWLVAMEGGRVQEIPNGGAILEWDAKLDFRLERSFRIEVDIARVLGVEPRSLLCELIVCGVTGSGLRRQVFCRKAIRLEAGFEIPVSFKPSSEVLAKELRLISGVYLAADAVACDKLAPWRKGSRLWECSDLLRLEGGAARLPMYEVEFSKVFAGDLIDNADFHVELLDDPGLELEAALSVYINAERPEFVAELSTPGSAAERRLWAGIIRRVVASQILSGELGVGTSGENNTLAATVNRWVKIIWPTLSAESVRGLPAAGYSRFEGQIESWVFSLGGDESKEKRA